MRVIFGAVLALAIAYGGYWFVGSRMFERGVDDWFRTQVDAGLIAEREGSAVRGFPSRFDLTLDNVRIADPETGWGWRAPFVQAFMLSYKPNHVIVALPDDQVVETPLGEVTVTSQGLKGSVRLGMDLSPARTAATGEAIRAARGDTELTAQSFRFGSILDTGRVHDVALEVVGLGLAAPGVRLENGTLTVAGKMTLAVPSDEVPVTLPMDAVSITEGMLRIGAITASVTGDVVADAQGFASGQVLLRLEDWPAALDAAVQAGLIPEGRAETLEGGFRMMAEGDAVELPLTLANGVVRFGPLPLAPAPRLK